MGRPFFLYRYKDAKTGEIKYIGKTGRLFVRERLSQHINDAIGIWAQNNPHIIEVLELPKEEDMNYLESYLIRLHTPEHNVVYADNSLMPPFEIILPEHLWKEVNEYEKEKNAENATAISKDSFMANIMKFLEGCDDD